jgi:hypothetical protein
MPKVTNVYGAFPFFLPLIATLLKSTIPELFFMKAFGFGMISLWFDI